jgi:hypothetical protein
VAAEQKGATIKQKRKESERVRESADLRGFRKLHHLNSDAPYHLITVSRHLDGDDLSMGMLFCETR